MLVENVQNVYLIYYLYYEKHKTIKIFFDKIHFNKNIEHFKNIKINNHDK